MSRPGTVLLVDDEETVGRLVRRHLVGWDVIQAFAVTGVPAQADAIGDLRLVLLDLNLSDTTYPEPLDDNPFQGSFVLARELRRAHPNVPVVIFSAHVNGAIVNAAHLIGAGLLSKNDCAPNLALLGQRLDLAARAGDRRAASFLAWLRAHRGMTARESDVAALAVRARSSSARTGTRDRGARSTRSSVVVARIAGRRRPVGLLGCFNNPRSGYFRVLATAIS